MIAKKRLLTILMAVLMVFAMMPMTAGTVYAASGDPVVGFTGVLGTGVNTDNAQTIYYGVNGEKPIAWRVIKYKDKGNTYIENQDDTMTLFAADNLISGVQFNPNTDDGNDYNNSGLKSVIDGMYGSLFSSQERSAIESRTLGVNEFVGQEPYSTGVSGTETSGYLWPLSTAEARALPSDTFRSASYFWWLRSPDADDYSIAYIYDNGRFFFGLYVNNYLGVRPAFNLNLESVLFTSAAEGGKSSGGEGADALSAISDNTKNEWKLTLHDSSRDGFKASAATGAVLSAKEGYESWSVPVNYKFEGDDPYSIAPAPTEKDYVSVILADSEDNALYYGNIDRANNVGTKNVSIPTGLAAGEYKLHVFYEKINGDKLTDYSSAFRTINLTVTEPPVTHTVTVNNGTGGGEYSEGENVTITANAPETGMKFKKWTGTDGLTFTEGNATTSTAIFTMPSEAVTLTATYKMDSSNYFVRITQEDGSEQLIELAGKPSDSIDAVMAKIQDKTGFPPDQQQLYYDGTFMEPGHTLADFGITKGDIMDLVLIHVTYTVTINSGTGSGNYTEGESVTITANAPETGMKFKEWTGADELTFTSGSASSAIATFTMPTNAVTLTATYEYNPAPPAETFTVTFKAGGGVWTDGTTADKQMTVDKGQAATAPDVPTREGYTFNGWDPEDFSNITSNLTVTAQWKENSEPQPQPAAQTITASNVTKTYGNAAFSLGAKTSGDGTLTYKSSNTKVVTVDSSGKVTIEGAGTAKITISASATAKYNEATKTITVTVNKAANPLKMSPKMATVKYKKLKKQTQALAVTKVIGFTNDIGDSKTYTLSSAKKGKKSFKKYFKINKTTGKVTIKKNKKMKKGTYKVKVKIQALGNSNYKASAVKTVTFKVKIK